MTDYRNGIAEVRVEIPLRSEFLLTFLTFTKGAHDYNDHIETLIIIMASFSMHLFLSSDFFKGSCMKQF